MPKLENQPTLTEKLTRPYSFPGEIKNSLDMADFPALAPYFNRWQKEMSEFSVIDPEFRNRVIGKFRALHNLENPKPGDGEQSGAKLAHNTLTNFLYSDNILPCLSEVHREAWDSKDMDALTSSSTALFVLDEALNVIDQYAREKKYGTHQAFVTDYGKVNYPAAFADMMAGNLNGNPHSSTFTELMKVARIMTRQCLFENQNKDLGLVEVSEGVLIPFREAVQKPIREFEEAKSGIKIPRHIIDRLSRARALVLSLDYNSTWNRRESFANTEIIVQVMHQIHEMEKMATNLFPNLNVYVVLNTGRPARYAWGVLDSIDPDNAVRHFAIAESGGVILTEIQHGREEVAVPNPKSWKKQLDSIRTFLRGNIKNGYDSEAVKFEDKSSMVSLQVSPRDSQNGDWHHKSIDGQAVNPEWVVGKVGYYLAQEFDSMSRKMKDLKEHALSNQKLREGMIKLITAYPKDGVDGIPSTGDELNGEFREGMLTLFKEVEDERAIELEEVTQAMETLDLMKQKLTINYNSTAGFVDIMHKDLNKYSTLKKCIENRGIDITDAIVIHVGDSGTDEMPEDDGVVNRCSSKVFNVCIADGSKGLKQSVNKRGEYGYITARRSALGLIDVLVGLTNGVRNASISTNH